MIRGRGSDACDSDLFRRAADSTCVVDYRDPRVSIQIVVGPTLFAGLSQRVDLKLVSRLEFGSGAVAMRYEPRR